MSPEQRILPLDRRAVLQWMAAASAGALVGDARSAGAAEIDHVPVAGQFPNQPGNYLAGELVAVDGINRRGSLRLDGDHVDDRYDKAQPQHFAMLPYGMIYYQGAPAELRDIPLGTHLHGTYFLPPKGEEETVKPTVGPPQYGSKYNHAILLEDDFSFFQRRGWSWRIGEIIHGDGELNVGGVLLRVGDRRLKVVAKGTTQAVTFEKEHNFWIDEATRVWKGRELLDWDALAADQDVHVSLSWSPEWRFRQFRVSDVWIDEASRTVATEKQRRIHINYQKHRGIPGWIDHVEVEPGGKGNGIVTLTLFGGMDPTLYEQVREDANSKDPVTIILADRTLRVWSSNNLGPIVELKETAKPPLGSSGLQIRVPVKDLLVGHRPGQIVRVRLSDFRNVKFPPEERMWGFPGV